MTIGRHNLSLLVAPPCVEFIRHVHSSNSKRRTTGRESEGAVFNSQERTVRIKTLNNLGVIFRFERSRRVTLALLVGTF